MYMEKIEFEKLLLQTAFCCLAADGDIDQREIDLIKNIFGSKDQYKEVDFDTKMNSYIKFYNEKGKEFFHFYFDLLDKSNLSEEEELELIDMAIQTIHADDKVEYSEIKFFKVIRHHLKVSDENILSKFPDLEFFLEEDIDTSTTIDKLIGHYFDTVELSKFDLIDIGDISNE